MSRALLLTVAVLLAACAQTSDFQRPAAPVPEDWPKNWPTSSDSYAIRDVAKTHWRAFFADPQLQALIAISLDNNRDLRIAAARVLEARAQYGVVRADELPTISALGMGNSTRTPADLNSSGAASTSNRFDASLSTVSYEFDFWGRLANLSESARLSYLATEEARRSVHLSLVADVASAYYSLIQLRELTEQTKATLELRRQSLALLTKGKDIGATDDYVVQQASGIVDATLANLASIEHQGVIAKNRLDYLVGKVAADLPAGKSLDDQGLDAQLSPGLPSEVLLLRPDVVAAEQRLKATHANIAAARAAFLPKIMLTASLGLASQGLAGLFSGGAWAFQPLISLPIFDGGRTAANVDVAKAREIIAVAEYEKTIQMAFREVADLLSARESLTRQLRASTANASAQERRLLIAQARFNGGMVGYLEVLDAQREVVVVQQNITQVRRSQLESAAQLYKALGGGSSV